MNQPSPAVECASWCKKCGAHTDVHHPEGEDCASEPKAVLLSLYPLRDGGEDLRVPDHLTGVLHNDAGASQPRIKISHNDKTVIDLSLEKAARLAADLHTLAEQAQA